MAKVEDTKKTEEQTPAFVRPTGLTNYAQKYPIYDGGDARVLALGTKAPPIHGNMLGMIRLPSVQKDNKREWWGIVFDLLQPCPVKGPEKDGAGNPIKRMAQKGERIVLTESVALERYSKAADHPKYCFEAYIEPIVSQTKERNRLWDYPVVEIGPRSIPRTEAHRTAAMLDWDDEKEEHPQLPAGPANGKTASTDDAPFG